MRWLENRNEIKVQKFEKKKKFCKKYMKAEVELKTNRIYYEK